MSTRRPAAARLYICVTSPRGPAQIARRRRTRRRRRTGRRATVGRPVGRRRPRPGTRRTPSSRSVSRVPKCRTQPAEGEHRGALVDQRAQLELLGRHEPRRPEHPAHVVEARAASVGVEVDDLEGAGLEVDDQAAVVEVAGDPSGRGQADVQVDEDVEDARASGPPAVARTAGRPRSGQLAAARRACRQLPLRRLVDQDGPGRRLDDVEQARQRRVGARGRQRDGVAQQS